MYPDGLDTGQSTVWPVYIKENLLHMLFYSSWLCPMKLTTPNILRGFGCLFFIDSTLGLGCGCKCRLVIEIHSLSNILLDYESIFNRNDNDDKRATALHFSFNPKFPGLGEMKPS